MRSPGLGTLALLVSAVTAACGSSDSADIAEFCATWRGQPTSVIELLPHAPEPIDDEVGRYVARSIKGDDVAELEQVIDAWTQEQCPEA